MSRTKDIAAIRQRPDGKSWLAVYPCGCVGGATLRGANEREAAAILEERSLLIEFELVTVEEARQRLSTGCDHKPKWGGVR